MLPKQHRFSSRSEIRQVFRHATRKQSDSLIWLSNQPARRANLPWRAAVIVSKKVAPLATDRNAIRRKITEALWQQKNQIKQGIDIVILAQKKSLHSTTSNLFQEVQFKIH